MMKKLIALLMAAVMALSLAGCNSADKNNGSQTESAAGSSTTESRAEESKAAESSKAEESSAAEPVGEVLPAGTYHLVGTFENDETMGTDTLQRMSGLGLTGELVLNEDGTGTLTLYGESGEITWDDKAIIINENRAPYVFEDDLLTVTAGDGSTQLFFSGMTPEELIAAGKGIEGTGQYAPVEAPALDGDGDVYHLIAMWTVDQTVGTDQIAMLDAMGMSSALQLNSDGTGTLVLYGAPVEISWRDNVIIAEGGEITFEQEEDHIILWEDDSYLMFSLQTAQEKEDAGEGIESVDNREQVIPAAITVAGADWVDLPEEDKEILAVWLDVENIGTDGFSLDWEAESVITQGADEIYDEWYWFDDEELDALYDELMREILPGGRNRVGLFFEADPEGGMIHLEITDRMEEIVFVDEVLDPANLPGAPAEPYVHEKVTEYPELEGISSAGTLNEDYEVEILETGFKEPEFEFEKRTFKVVLEFRNNSQKATSFWSEIDYMASQDRFGLQSANEENAFEDVAAGGKITVTLEWELYNDSPIAVVLSDFWDDAMVGGVYPAE